MTAKVKKIPKEEPPMELDTKQQLPEPKGWKVLVAMPKSKEKTDGGIIKAAQTRDLEDTANIAGYVMKLGPDCYNDERRFPSGAWCKAGDWVIFRAYSGTRIKMYGHEFRLINDDTVEAVVDDPTGVVRA
jgi:co-chaperonin GroES (HSP10)